jgi:hypothetical protein
MFARPDLGPMFTNEDCFLLMPDKKPKISDTGIAFLARIKS